MKNCTKHDCHTCHGPLSYVYSSKLCPDCGAHLTKNGLCLVGCQLGVSQEALRAKQNARARVLAREAHG
jgi:hypothetical protein